MSMFDQYETDSDLEKDGVWFENEDYRIKIAHAGGSNKKYATYFESKTKPLRRAITAGTLDPKRGEAILHDVYAHTIVKAWEISEEVDKDGKQIWKSGIHKKGGGILPFNVENVMETFRLLPKLFADIQQFSEGITMYRKEDLEEEAKN